MNMDIETALLKFSKVCKVITHNGNLLPPDKLKKILQDAYLAGYKTLKDIPDEFINERL